MCANLSSLPLPSPRQKANSLTGEEDPTAAEEGVVMTTARGSRKKIQRRRRDSLLAERGGETVHAGNWQDQQERCMVC